jgi:hypothetical protein
LLGAGGLFVGQSRLRKNEQKSYNAGIKIGAEQAAKAAPPPPAAVAPQVVVVPQPAPAAK